MWMIFGELFGLTGMVRTEKLNSRESKYDIFYTEYAFQNVCKTAANKYRRRWVQIGSIITVK